MKEIEVLTKGEVMQRYHVGRAYAEKIIREAKSLCGGGITKQGTISDRELERWEKAHGLS